MPIPTALRAAALTATLTFVLPAAGRGVSVDDATWADRNEAKLSYSAGARAYDKKELETALARFKESYETVASPNSHLMIAKVLIDLKRYVDAYHELAGVIAEAEAAAETEKYAKTAESARALRKDLEARIGFVQVESGGVVSVRGRPVPPGEWDQPIAVEAGEVEIEVAPTNGEKRKESVQVGAGTTVRVRMNAPPTRDAPANTTITTDCPSQVVPTTGRPPGLVPQRTVGLVTGGLGVAGLATFVTFGLLDRRQYATLEEECSGNTCPERLADDAERGRTYQALANVGLGVAVVGVSTGTVLVLTAKRPGRPAHARLQPELRVGPASITVVGAFR